MLRHFVDDWVRIAKVMGQFLDTTPFADQSECQKRHFPGVGMVTAEQFDEWVRPEDMLSPEKVAKL